ncbi:methyltransferase domain-containing protein [Ilumatobacter sp.]|uniref:class I SAM-dependent methyltransferase n=1 Tax=Ilumatobacter sp. TaxID=1967498 RepID=UPI003B52D263
MSAERSEPEGGAGSGRTAPEVAADDPYDVEFDWAGAHGRLASELIGRPERGVVVDLGCGYAPHAEVLRDAGFSYVGFDVEERSLETVRGRGFEVHRIDLRDVDTTLAALDGVDAAGREPLVAILAIDVIEHLVEPHLFLERLSGWMADRGAVLGVSVPNVAHRDVAHKLLAGRWDVTRSGLLDHTHLRFFTDRSLTTAMAAAGFDESARADRPAPESDQSWPRRHPFVAADTALGAFLRSVRDRVDADGDTYQFIRLYRPATRTCAPTLVTASGTEPAVFLSVVADPAGGADSTDRVRDALRAQDVDDAELVEVDPRAPAGSAIADAVARARGSHLAIVGAGDEPGPGWVGALRDTAGGGGRVLRCRAAELVGAAAPVTVDGWSELGDLGGPAATVAFPLDAVRALGAALDEALDDELAPVVGLLLATAGLCGVRETDEPALARGVATSIDRVALDRRLAQLDRHPFLLPAGHLGRARALGGAGEVAVATGAGAAERLDELERANHELALDNAWLNRELAAVPVRLARRLLRRPPSRPR